MWTLYVPVVLMYMIHSTTYSIATKKMITLGCYNFFSIFSHNYFHTFTFYVSNNIITLAYCSWVVATFIFIYYINNLIEKGYSCLPAPICIYRSRSWIRIYRHWLIRTGNNKSQRLYTLLLFLVLLPNSFVTVIVDRSETKGNLGKKQMNG